MKKLIGLSLIVLLYVGNLGTQETKAKGIPAPATEQKTAIAYGAGQSPAQGADVKPAKESKARTEAKVSDTVMAKGAASDQEINSLDFAEFKVDEEAKRQSIVALVKDGIEYFTKHRNEQAFFAFMNDPRFVIGDVQLFVFDANGTILVHEITANLWSDYKEVKNNQGNVIVDVLIKKAEKGGGWVEYEWQGDFKSSYVEKIEKEGVVYFIGAGWYPGNKKYAVENLVKNAVHFFNTEGRDFAFERINNKIGMFVRGDLYVFAYDYNGYCVAHGDNVALIGRDFSKLKDDNGILLIQELLKLGKQGGGWLSYKWKNAPKMGYAEKVSDKTGDYIIGSGYYPEDTRGNVVSLVKKGIKFFNAWGREHAAAQFNVSGGDFTNGTLSLFLYDFNGKALANGNTPDYVGQNILELRSPAGDYIVKDMVEKAKKGGGWITYQWKNDLIASYVEALQDKEGSYVIGSGFFPDTRKEKVMLLVKRGIAYLRIHAKQNAIREFARRGGPFVRGTLSLFMFNLKGDCLVYGDNHNMIWRNFSDFKDIDGKNVFKLFMQAAKSGGGWVEYKSKNSTKVAYIEMVEEEGENYLIGSAFYK